MDVNLNFFTLDLKASIALLAEEKEVEKLCKNIMKFLIILKCFQHLRRFSIFYISNCFPPSLYSDTAKVIIL